jgi:hypothetical protein
MDQIEQAVASEFDVGAALDVFGDRQRSAAL